MLGLLLGPRRRTPLSAAAKVYVRSSQTMPELMTGSVRLLFESPPYEKMHPCCNDPSCLACYQGEDFVERLAKFLPERLRVLADDGNYVLNLQPQVINGFTSPVEYLLPQAIAAAGFRLVQTHIWAKPNANPFAPDRRLKNSFEYCWHFAKTKDYVFNKNAVREPHEWADKDHRKEKYHPLGKDPGNVFFAAKSQDQTSLDHPGKMKDGIATRFIKLLSAPGDLCVDGFTGTGQTGVEAIALGRKFIGYELHKDRAAQARQRLGIDGAAPETTMNTSMSKTWMTPKEVAAYTSMSVATIYSKSSRGEIPVHHIGKLPRYHRDEIDAWIRGIEIPPPSAIQTPQDSANPGLT